MRTDGLLIDIEFCTGCRACEAACRQEHQLPVGIFGIKVQEIFLNDGQTFNYVPVPTDLCNLCEELVSEGKKPACIHHCMAQVMKHGPIQELAEEMLNHRRRVLWNPKPKPPKSPLTGKNLLEKTDEH